MRRAAFDDAKNFLNGDEVIKRGQSGDERRGEKREGEKMSYVGLRVVCENGDEEAPVESVGYAVSSKSMREGTGGFQESTRLRHCGERGRQDCGRES